MDPQTGRNGHTRLHRSRQERILFGVCGGLAEYFGVDPSIVRIAFVVVALIPPISVLSILGYPILAVILPSEGTEQLTGREAIRGNVTELRTDLDELAASARARVASVTRGRRAASDEDKPSTGVSESEASPPAAPATEAPAVAGAADRSTER